MKNPGPVTRSLRGHNGRETSEQASRGKGRPLGPKLGSPLPAAPTLLSPRLYFTTKRPPLAGQVQMLVAEVTTTDLRRTRYQVESTDDIRKTRQGYEIETASGETVQFSEENVESISVVEE